VKQVIYTCDYCKEPVEFIQMIRAEWYRGHESFGRRDFCSVSCFGNYVILESGKE
jgi:hypothetical protein